MQELTIVASLTNRYGVLMTLNDIAEATKTSYQTLLNKRSSGTFPIPTKLKLGKVVALTSDVANYIEGDDE